MSAKLIGAQAPYGAFELKRCYQKNMLTGTLISGGLPLMILAVFVIIAYIGSLGTVETLVPPVIADGPYKIPPPTKFKSRGPQINVTVKKPDIPKIGIPTPVEDDEVITVNVVASIKEKENLIMADGLGDGGDIDGLGYNYDDLIIDIIPPPDTFIPHTVEPVLLSAPPPDYPGLARRAEIEGDVTVQVYINEEGDVVNAVIAKPSGSNAGFEEAALAVAMLRKYRPAMQNENPVALWLSYVVRFRLKN